MKYRTGYIAVGVMSTQPKSFLTPGRYLAIGCEAPYESEYYNGEMFAVEGVEKVTT